MKRRGGKRYVTSSRIRLNSHYARCINYSIMNKAEESRITIYNINEVWVYLYDCLYFILHRVIDSYSHCHCIIVYKILIIMFLDKLLSQIKSQAVWIWFLVCSCAIVGIYISLVLELSTKNQCFIHFFTEPKFIRSGSPMAVWHQLNLALGGDKRA